MNQTQVMVKMILDRWQSLNKEFNTALDAMSDEQLQKEIAPGKNRGIWLLGHMVVVHDDMLPILDFGDKIFPAINQAFKAADRSVAEIPSASELRENWKKISEVLDGKIATLQPEQWFEKHTTVSAEDFQKEPHRNKLNIMVTRVSHLAYHTGQFKLLK